MRENLISCKQVIFEWHLTSMLWIKKRVLYITGHAGLPFYSSSIHCHGMSVSKERGILSLQFCLVSVLKKVYEA